MIYIYVREEIILESLPTQVIYNIKGGKLIGAIKNLNGSLIDSIKEPDNFYFTTPLYTEGFLNGNLIGHILVKSKYIFLNNNYIAFGEPEEADFYSVNQAKSSFHFKEVE